MWPRGEVERQRRRKEEVAVEAEVSELGELTQRLSRTGKVEILEEEPGDPMGSGVAGDPEPRGGTGVGRVDPGKERVGRVRGGLEGKQGRQVFWVREGKREGDTENECDDGELLRCHFSW